MNRNLIRLQWALPIGLLTGWAATASALHPLGPEYLLLTLVSMAALVLLLLAMPTVPAGAMLPYWLLLVILLGFYYFKFYLIAGNAIDVTSAQSGFPATVPMSADTLLKTYEEMTWSFLAFCVTGIAFIPLVGRAARGAKQYSDRTGAGFSRASARVALFSTAALAALILGITVVLHVEMGIWPDWPFHLFTVFNVANTIALPTLILLTIDLSLHGASRRIKSTTMVTIAAYVALNMVLTTSKGTLLIIAAGVSLLWILEERTISWKELAIAASALVFTALIFPLFIAYRSLLMSGPYATAGFGDRIAVLELAAAEVGSHSAVVQQSGGTEKFIWRLTGADIVLGFIDYNVKPLGIEKLLWVLAHYRTVTWYIAREIFADDVEPGMMGSVSASSLVGLFYVIDGTPGVIGGMAIFFSMVLLAWVLMMRLHPRALSVIQASFLLVVVLPIAQEGTPGYSRASWLLVAVIVESIARLGASMDRHHRIPRPPVTMP